MTHYMILVRIGQGLKQNQPIEIKPLIPDHGVVVRFNIRESEFIKSYVSIESLMAPAK